MISLCCIVRDNDERHKQTEQIKKKFHELDVGAQESWQMTMLLKILFMFERSSTQ